MKTVELPVAEPVYSTFHYQGNVCGALAQNPSIRNYFLNQASVLQCSRKFLRGFTTPEITVRKSSYAELPCVEIIRFGTRYIGGYIHCIIRRLLRDGYCVAFSSVDDFYVEGKSFYGERHFLHDGLICGYSAEDKTYSIFAYDQRWIYRVFKTPIDGFEKGRRAAVSEGKYGTFAGLRAKDETIPFLPEEVYGRLKQHLESNFSIYPKEEDGTVLGIVVHDYLALYLDKLYRGEIPYARMDRRVLRLLWEHKKLMLERIERLEAELGMDTSLSTRYRGVVKKADDARMLYAIHHMREKPQLLPVITEKVLEIGAEEKEILTLLTERMENMT